MAKIPKGIKIQQSDNSVTLITSNYSDPLYLMQVMLFIPFLVILLIVFLFALPFDLSSLFFFLVPLFLLGVIIRWIQANKKDHYKIQLNAKQLLITKGMNKDVIIQTDLRDIRAVYIVLVTKSTAGEFANDPILDNRNELVIETMSDRIVVTNSLLDSEQVFIKNKILKWREEAFEEQISRSEGEFSNETGKAIKNL